MDGEVQALLVTGLDAGKKHFLVQWFIELSGAKLPIFGHKNALSCALVYSSVVMTANKSKQISRQQLTKMTLVFNEYYFILRYSYSRHIVEKIKYSTSLNSLVACLSSITHKQKGRRGLSVLCL